MPRLRPTSCNKPRRRGVLAAEALFVLPLFLLVALGVVGSADLLICEQLVDESSGRVARKIAMGAPLEDAEVIVLAVLGESRAEHATITIQGLDGSEWSQVPSGGLFEVRIEIAARYATTTGLAPVGGDELLIGRTVMQRE